MRTIIAGSRTVASIPWDQQHQLIADAIHLAGAFEEISPTVIISGRARGADRLGELYAGTRGWPVERYAAKWGEHGLNAGRIRNVEMAKIADACVVLWDGVSRGSNHMIETAKKFKLKLYVHQFVALPASQVDRHGVPTRGL